VRKSGKSALLMASNQKMSVLDKGFVRKISTLHRVNEQPKVIRIKKGFFCAQRRAAAFLHISPLMIDSYRAD
jgi:hypothetical protein